MGLVGADIAHLNAAASAMAPIASNVNGQAAAIVSAGSLAAGAAGNGNLAATITAVAQAAAAAARDTATITGNLQQAVEISATNVALATSTR
jgi:hypothetical protein